MQDMVPSVEGYLPQQPARPSGEQTDVQGIDMSLTPANNTSLEMPRPDVPCKRPSTRATGQTFR